jgi:hypothetical protein
MPEDAVEYNGSRNRRKDETLLNDDEHDDDYEDENEDHEAAVDDAELAELRNFEQVLVKAAH